LLVNNKGDIGKTLKDLSNSSTAKATLAAVLTAGVLAKLGTTSTMTELSRSGGFADKLSYNLINATGRALTSTAINGGDLQGALKSALIGGLVDTAQGQAASLIGQSGADYLSHKLAHALVGCVAGAAAGGACKDGAIGAALGEVVGQMFKPANGMFYTEAEKDKVLAYSKLVAGAVTAYAAAMRKRPSRPLGWRLKTTCSLYRHLSRYWPARLGTRRLPAVATRLLVCKPLGRVTIL